MRLQRDGRLRALATRAAGVGRAGALEEQHVRLPRHVGAVLDAVRDDDHLALPDRLVAVAEVHHQPALDDQEELVLLVVVMPHELALDLHDLDLEVVDLAGDARAAVVVETTEGLGDVDFLRHAGTVARRGARQRVVPSRICSVFRSE